MAPASRPEALAVKIAGEDISAWPPPARSATLWPGSGPCTRSSPRSRSEIARAILKEINERLGFLDNVGLDYLNLNRTSGTLSGGESQRIRLASQIGSGLSGVLYVLDEPASASTSATMTACSSPSAAARSRQHRASSSSMTRTRSARPIMSSTWARRRRPWRRDRRARHARRGASPTTKSHSPPTISPAPLSIPVPAKRRKGNGKKLNLTARTANNLKNVTASHPARHLHLHHRRLRLGQVELHHRHALRRAARQLNGARMTAGRHDRIDGPANISTR